MSTRVKDAGEFFEAEIATFDRFWQFQFLARSSRGFKPVTLARRVPKMWILLSSRRVSILFLIGRKPIKRFTSIRLQFRKNFALLKKPYGVIMTALMGVHLAVSALRCKRS